jgi:hypothetical protein
VIKYDCKLRIQNIECNSEMFKNVKDFCLRHEDIQEGGVEVFLHSFLTSVLKAGARLMLNLDRFAPGKGIPVPI